jgi:hypothetical protein
LAVTFGVGWLKRYLLSGLDDIRAGAVVLAAAETAAVRGVIYNI